MQWVLILTICMAEGTGCFSQPVGFHDTKQKCLASKYMHEELPTDGQWSSIDYECKLLGGAEV